MLATRCLALMLVSLTAARCAGPAGVETETRVLSPAQPGPIVARIGAETITAAELQDFARTAQIGDARQALERYAELRLLAAHAIKRGALGDPLVRDVARRAEVQTLLARAVEARVTEHNVPRGAVEAARRTRGFALSHGPLQYVWHALLPRDADAGPSTDTTARRARAEAIRAALTAHTTPLDFNRVRAIAEGIPGEGAVRVEQVHGFDPSGATGRADTIDPEFARAAAAIERPNGVSPVVETPFGLHVIVLERREDGVTTDPAEVERAVLGEAVSLARARALQALLVELRARYRVRLVDNPEASR